MTDEREDRDDRREAETPVEPVDMGLTGRIEGLRQDEPDWAPESPVEPLAVEPPAAEPPAVATGMFSALLDGADAGSAWEAAIADASDVTQVMPAVAEVAAPREIDLGPEHRTRWWVWALAVTGVLAVLGVAVYVWWWTTSRPIVVPDIVGKRPAEATQSLNNADLRLGKVSEVPTDSAPVGTVIRQLPEAGSQLKPDGAVSFVVASAPEQAKVPNVEGISETDAAKALAVARLRPIQVGSYNATVAVGFVIAQLPPQGSELSPGSGVAVVISRGPAPSSATVPKAVGLGENDAVTLIRAAGLQARVYRSYNASIAAGEIVTQTPLPGTSAVPNGVVQVLVSQGAGSTSVTVPDLLGDTRSSAQAQLKDKGLAYQVVIVPNATVGRNKVISQMPRPGMGAASGAVVGLLISSGNVTQGTVPSLVGTASADASAAIRAAGFTAHVIGVETASQTPGMVFAQFPPAGTGYATRYPVVCLVAEAPKP